MDWSPSEIAEAQALYDQRRSASKIARHFSRRGKSPDLTSADVLPILNSHRAKAPTASAEQIAEIRRILQTEWISNRAIAERVGISHHIVERACAGIRAAAKAPHPCKKRSSYTMQGQRTDLVDGRLIRFAVPEPIEVPSWVPDHLYELYEHTARTQDEHVAARVVRELKRGNAVAASIPSRFGASDLDPSEPTGAPRSRIRPSPATGREQGWHLHSDSRP